ncbi:transposase domain-containing protein [Rhizophagus irregularis DAOM 181602=DAOM 197198]|nr:transposase domain-containing protein [Rhizophagus irregularis DAOM 181602=DAOM 197198]
MSNNKVLCICSKCKKKGSDNIGKYVHPTTKWRHIKNAKKNYNFSDNDDDSDDDDSDNDDNNNNNNDHDDDNNDIDNDDNNNDHDKDHDDDNDYDDDHDNDGDNDDNNNDYDDNNHDDNDVEYKQRNEFDNRSSRSPTPVLMVIDDDCYDDNQEHHDNRDNSDEKTESSTATESESYESLYDSFDDNNTFEVLQKGLYSSDNESSDDGINLTEGSNIVGSNINSINDEVARVPIKPIWVDMCINSCCAFTGNLETLNKCTYCKAERYQEGGRPRAQVAYFSIQNRFKIQYQDPTRAKQLRYRSEYITREDNGAIGDVFDGSQYKNLSQEGYFQDDRDIALLGSVDGYQLFKQKCDDCWIVLFINANLPPHQRVKKENLLITSIIPGPKAPKNFNSFMKPIVEELCLLNDGVECYDGATNENFLLKVMVLSWSGDTPGLSKLACLTGHNSYMACRYCDLRGIYNNHVYYPTTPPPSIETYKTYNPSDLPKRTHRDYMIRIEQITTIPPSRTRDTLISDLGVTGRSVLLEIETTQFPTCFPIDIMHLFYENIALYMLKHWMGCFFKDSILNDQPYVINNKQWTEIGIEMETIRKSIPTDFGRPPRNILHHHNGYKAEEWASWITLYSLPLLKDRLPANYLKEEIRKLLLLFYQHYERYYYQFLAARLSVMKVCFHYILHVADSIQDTGPCWSTWQFPMEHTCGMLQPLAKSRLHPYKNLTNNVYLLELFNNLCYFRKFYDQIFPPISDKKYKKHLVYTNENYEEEFQWPSKPYTLTFQEVKKIKDHLCVIDDRASEMRLNDFETNGTKFGRLITSDGRVIGSEWIRRNKDWARINYTVLTRLEIDKWAHLPSAIPEFVTKSFYAQVNYYFLYGYMDQKIMLANVTWTNEVNEDSLGTTSFVGDGSTQFIDVTAINRCVGFMKLGRKTYIIDKECMEEWE